MTQYEQLLQSIKQRSDVAAHLNQDLCLKQKEMIYLAEKGKDNYLKAISITAQNINNIKDLTFNRINKINALYSFYNQTYLQLLQKRKIQMPIHDFYNQTKLGELEMDVQSVLRFQALSLKKNKVRQDFANKFSMIRDEIKKLKLKISLTQFQLNEVSRPTKRDPKN